MGREVSEEAPSAPESASTSTATTEVFPPFGARSSPIWEARRGGCVPAPLRPGQRRGRATHDAQRAPQRASPKVLRRRRQRRPRADSRVSRREARDEAPPAPTSEKDSPNKFSARMTARLTTDQTFFAHSAGALYRVPERIAAQDLLAAMRRLEPPSRASSTSPSPRPARSWRSGTRPITGTATPVECTRARLRHLHAFRGRGERRRGCDERPRRVRQPPGEFCQASARRATGDVGARRGTPSRRSESLRPATRGASSFDARARRWWSACARS